MKPTILLTYTTAILLLVGCCAGVGSYIILQNADATGGAGEIKGLIDPMLERAIQALENNNTELALEEIQTLKNELDDTFEVDESEDEQEED
jgi:hypothetical protein